MNLLPLVDDGASFKCGYTNFLYGETWECPKAAVGLMSERVHELAKLSLNKDERLFTRGLCSSHAAWFGFTNEKGEL